MPSSNFVLPTIISFLLTLNLCSADLPGPTGPSAPNGPNTVNPPGYDCAFKPPSGCGPDTTTPAYNACLVRDSSVSEFIQCANETSTIGSDDDDSKPLNALNVLVTAIKIPACNKCIARAPFTDYQSVKDKSVKLANYLCGKVDDGDICCLSNCLGARQPEHNLNGICKNGNVNLWDNDPNYCGSGAGGGGGGGGDSDNGNDQTAASSATVTNASKMSLSTSSNFATHTTSPTQTVAPSTSLSAATQTSSPTQTPSSSPVRDSSVSASSSIRAASMIALGLLVVILTVGIWGAV